ncbi:hypothetical protein ABMX96_22335, partial [Vibrio vulnificus]
LASDALAIRIVFPLVRVTPFSFKWTGLPALLGKQQKAWSETKPFNYMLCFLLYLSPQSVWSFVSALFRH